MRQLEKGIVGLVLTLVFIFAIFSAYTIARAGSLAPLASPSASGYTLEDIYNRLTAGTEATESDHTFAPAGAPAGSLYTFSQIYSAIPTIDATKVLAGTTYLGVAGTALVASGNAGAGDVLATATFSSSTAVNVTGTIPVKAGDTASASSSAQGTSLVITVPQGYYSGASSVTVSTTSANFIAGNIRSGVELFGLTGTMPIGYTYGDNSAGYVLVTASATGTALANLWTGTRTDGGFPGGSQSAGGVDDYNNADPAPADRYTGPAGWTQCNAGNNYCGTGEAGADAKDNSTGLIYSLPCNGSACASFSDAAPLTYNWTAAGGNDADNGGVDATALCASGAHGRSGWSLPTQKQLVQAYIDGSYGNLEASGVNRNYWSATTQSNSTGNAWYTYLSYGYTLNNNKTTTSYYVRCVRPAP